MVHVALYNDHQHEQYTCSTRWFALRESATEAHRWTPIWDEEQQAFTSQLMFRVEDDTLTFEIAPETLCTANGQPVRCGEAVTMPCTLRIGQTWLEIATAGVARALVPVTETSLDELLTTSASEERHPGPSSATITGWLTAAGELHRAAAGSAEFYADAARFVVATVGLDAAWILRPVEAARESTWQIAGSHVPHPERGIRFDPTAIETLENSTKTWFQRTPSSNSGEDSQAIVLAPVRDEAGQLVAAVYGVRDTVGKNRRRGVRPLEARLVQLLAESVAVGIARMRHETEATRTRVLLEQAFSPTVAEYLQQHPESLLGQERDVTLMFADLRGYTTLAETMALTDCYELLGDVMEALTQVVVQQRGVVVDYYGDGLLALWNAPIVQSNHADLACTAAVQMFEALPEVDRAWQSRLNGPLELGIGIHSGPAFVGNAGTRSRIKYGPRGNTVNVASRVQAASKQLQLPLVITAATQTKLTDKFFTLRVCTAKLPGLERPAELFTAYPASKAARVKSRLDEYSQALELFESGDLEQAESLLNDLTSLGQTTPASFLAHYTAAQKNGNLGRRAVDKYATGHGPVIEIQSK